MDLIWIGGVLVGLGLLLQDGDLVKATGFGETYGGAVALAGVSEFLISTKVAGPAKRKTPWISIGLLALGALLLTAHFVG